MGSEDGTEDLTQPDAWPDDACNLAIWRHKCCQCWIRDETGCWEIRLNYNRVAGFAWQVVIYGQRCSPLWWSASVDFFLKAIPVVYVYRKKVPSIFFSADVRLSLWFPFSWSINYQLTTPGFHCTRRGFSCMCWGAINYSSRVRPS